MPSGAGIRYAPLDTDESSAVSAEAVPLTSDECSAECEVVEREADPEPATLHLPPPPCYEDHQESAAAAGDATNAAASCQDEDVYTPPPDYNVASKLPTYEEAERSKEEGTSTSSDNADAVPGHPLANSFPYRYAAMIPGFDDYHELDMSGNSNIRLGNDVVFFSTFLISFLFNWIGFLLSHCLSQSIAGRFGALAGFGLSMVKWTVIMKHSFQLEAMQTEWLWWIILLLGLLMFFRGTVQYIRIKHQWSSLTSEARMQYARFF